MNEKPLFTLGLILSIIHYFLAPPKNIFQILPGILINIYFLYVLLFFQRFKFLKYFSTIVFILTFIQLIYYYHYRIFIPLGAYSFILNEPRMLQEVLLMADALYFIIPGILFYWITKIFKSIFEKGKFCFKKNIRYLILHFSIFSLLVLSRENLNETARCLFQVILLLKWSLTQY